MNSVTFEPGFIGRIRKAQEKTDDPEMCRLLKLAKSEDARFRLCNGILYRVGTPTDRLIIPSGGGLRKLLISELHESHMKGHLGPFKTV